MAEVAQQLQFVWHFHQPYYSTPERQSNTLPWVRLHAIRSYYDMGRMLERHPEVSCVINFSGSLLEQFREYLEVGKRDSWWYLTEKPAANLTESDKFHLLRHFFSLDADVAMDSLPAYRRLYDKRGDDPEGVDPSEFSVQEFRDLQVLFNLAWFGFVARQERAVVRALFEKGENYSAEEKKALLEQQIEVMQLVIPLYRRLHQRGQIEISVTPMYHPILPLVVDTEVAERPSPDRPRPEPFAAPEDAREHVRRAETVVREVLGVDVDGMWPAEGAVSPEAVEMLDDAGLTWCASDEAILARSRGDDWRREHDLFRPWRLDDSDIAMFFRHRSLSDQIGFVYQDAAPEEAVDDLLERVREAGPETESSVVSVILDGENPWGDYPSYGEPFLEELYSRLEEVDDIETTTPTDVLEGDGDVSVLDDLASGSWIRGNYDIWIGHTETNRAWELLAETRRRLVSELEAGDYGVSIRQKAWAAIYMAEGSDWFWWFGDDFTSVNDADFDRLFRDQLRFVYRILDEEIPEELDTPIMGEEFSHAAFDPPRRLIKPRIDGRSDYYYEWSGAGVYRNTGSKGSMFDNTRFVDEIRIGFDLEQLYCRVAPAEDLLGRLAELTLELRVEHGSGPHRVRLNFDEGATGEVLTEDGTGHVPLELVAFDETLDFAVPFEVLEASPGDGLSLSFRVRDERMQLERHPPREGHFEVEVPDESFEMVNWMV